MKNIYSWFKAIVFLLVIFLMWLALVIVRFVTVVLSAILAKNDNDFKNYMKSLWLGMDYLVNDFLGGNSETTISSEVGAYAIAGSGTGLKMEIVINYGFLKIKGQKNHCRASIKPDDIHFTPPKVRALSLTGYVASIYTLNWIFA